MYGIHVNNSSDYRTKQYWRITSGIFSSIFLTVWNMCLSLWPCVCMHASVQCLTLKFYPIQLNGIGLYGHCIVIFIFTWTIIQMLHFILIICATQMVFWPQYLYYIYILNLLTRNFFFNVISIKTATNEQDCVGLCLLVCKWWKWKAWLWEKGQAWDEHSGKDKKMTTNTKYSNRQEKVKSQKPVKNRDHNNKLHHTKQRNPVTRDKQTITMTILPQMKCFLHFALWQNEENICKKCTMFYFFLWHKEYSQKTQQAKNSICSSRPNIIFIIPTWTTPLFWDWPCDRENAKCIVPTRTWCDCEGEDSLPRAEATGQGIS